jgi:hypothetical protein
MSHSKKQIYSIEDITKSLFLCFCGISRKNFSSNFKYIRIFPLSFMSISWRLFLKLSWLYSIYVSPFTMCIHFIWMINAVFHVKGPGLFFIVPCIDTYRYTEHGLINYIDTKAKCRHKKKLTCKGLCGRCLSVCGPCSSRFLFRVV